MFFRVPHCGARLRARGLRGRACGLPNSSLFSVSGKACGHVPSRDPRLIGDGHSREATVIGLHLTGDVGTRPGPQSAAKVEAPAGTMVPVDIAAGDAEAQLEQILKGADALVIATSAMPVMKPQANPTVRHCTTLPHFLPPPCIVPHSLIISLRDVSQACFGASLNCLSPSLSPPFFGMSNRYNH